MSVAAAFGFGGGGRPPGGGGGGGGAAPPMPGRGGGGGTVVAVVGVEVELVRDANSAAWTSRSACPASIP
jgi:hypothetical protein